MVLLAVDLLWIVFGIIYVIYKLHKEEHIFTRSNILLLLSIFVFIIAPQIIMNLVCDEDNIQIVRPIVTLVITVLPLLALCIYGLSFSVSREYKSKKESFGINSQDNQSIQGLRKIFEERGFHNISEKALEKLLKHPTSPLKTHGVAGANLQLCYNWMCDNETWEIDKLTRDDIGSLLGVPLDIIPLDENMKIGEASLKRTTLAKERLLGNQGLRYKNFSYYIVKSDEYYIFFNKFVDKYISEHQ